MDITVTVVLDDAMIEWYRKCVRDEGEWKDWEMEVMDQIYDKLEEALS